MMYDIVPDLIYDIPDHMYDIFDPICKITDRMKINFLSHL